MNGLLKIRKRLIDGNGEFNFEVRHFPYAA